MHCVGSVKGTADEASVLQMSYKVAHQDLDVKRKRKNNLAYWDSSGIRPFEERCLLQVGNEPVVGTVRRLHGRDMKDSAQLGQTLDFGDLRTRWTANLECLGLIHVDRMTLEDPGEMLESAMN